MEHTEPMSRIKEIFSRKQKNILSVFYTAGYPQLEDTLRIGKYLAGAGADIIEIGIPFSDPIADGPTIQRSNKKALENGMNLHLLIEQVAELRKEVSLPIVLMGYLNPVMQYGINKFLNAAVAAGVDGLIIPDLPMDEYQMLYKKQMQELGLDMVFLITPTTSPARIKKIDACSSGFVYAVSSSSTTGARRDFSQSQLDYFMQLKNLELTHPLLIGFGISNARTFQQACAHAQGAIVGSAFIELLSESKDMKKDIEQFVNKFKL